MFKLDKCFVVTSTGTNVTLPSHGDFLYYAFTVVGYMIVQVF